MSEHTLHLTLRRRRLALDADDRRVWQVAEEPLTLATDRVALLLCDVWDNHHSRGARERLEVMIPRLNAVVTSLRSRGAHIIHAPSDTMDFYADHPARRRLLAVEPVEPPADLPHDDPPLPIDSSDGGSDTTIGDIPGWPWTRQHPGIAIDEARDVIGAEGPRVYSFLRREGIERLLMMGVHTNMCVLHRPFGIKQMVRWGLPVALVRDLTDTMYNPERPPYVSHQEGTRLVVEFIEKFWCPTVASCELMGDVESH
jgi:nicotinamidase-related amidase